MRHVDKLTARCRDGSSMELNPEIYASVIYLYAVGFSINSTVDQELYLYAGSI
ncbi:MAG TPA: hypothetical protein VNL13_03420 [Sulfolobales archaeon]|nr:hypothetical protein [Sulfolobales archaeon]